MGDIKYANAAWLEGAVVEEFFCEDLAALTAGQAVCFDRDRGVAANVDGKRLQFVEGPSVSNNCDFAGILLDAKAAHTEGHVCVRVVVKGPALVNVGAASVALGDFLTADVLDGKFYAVGHKGRGTVKVLQTLTAAGLALAVMCEGEESGLVHTQALALAGAAVVLTPTGRTLIDGTLVVTAHATYTLANGKQIGERKSIKVTDLIGSTKNLVVTVTNGVQIDRTTALATLTFNAADEEAILEWDGMNWALLGYAGVTLA